MAIIGAILFFMLISCLLKDVGWGIKHTFRLLDKATTSEGLGKLIQYILLIVGGFILWILWTVWHNA